MQEGFLVLCVGTFYFGESGRQEEESKEEEDLRPINQSDSEEEGEMV